MGSRIKGVALALAGLGLLAGALGRDDARLIHEQMRSRVLERVGRAQVAAEDVRMALRADPDFDRLLAYHLKRLLHARRAPELAEDAVQATLFKIWKGRPEIFLREHEVVERYLSVATRRNLLSELKSAAAQPQELADDELEGMRHVAQADPQDATAAQELWDQLSARCGPQEREVLRQRLNGMHSAREIARETGLTRFTAERSSERIADRMERLRSTS